MSVKEVSYVKYKLNIMHQLLTFSGCGSNMCCCKSGGVGPQHAVLIPPFMLNEGSTCLQVNTHKEILSRKFLMN